MEGDRSGAVRFLLYSHDGLGLGHFRRNLVLAESIVAASPTASVLLACAAEGLETFTLPAGVDVLRLPGLRKVENGSYVGRRLNLGSARLRELRSSLLASAVRHFRPHVLLADKHPVGIDGELLPALRLQTGAGRRAALGLRDVLDEPTRAHDEWHSEHASGHIEAYYDIVLVYGSPELLSPLGRGFLGPDAADRVRYCGYVVAETTTEGGPDDLPHAGDASIVLATVGGGEDGWPVLDAFVAAANGAAWRGVLVAGPQLPASQWSRLRAAAARANVEALRSVRQVQRWYPHVAAIVCMGGYNTLVEAVSSGTPTVCVPRARPRAEQLIRARAFAAEGLLSVVEPDTLDSASLAAAIDDALHTPRISLLERARARLDTGGASRAAACLLDLAAGEAVPAWSRAAVAPVVASA